MNFAFSGARSQDVAVIVYHGYSDPWYDINGTEHSARAQYYGVGGIPDMFFDGQIRQTGWGGDNTVHGFRNTLLFYTPIFRLYSFAVLKL